MSRASLCIVCTERSIELRRLLRKAEQDRRAGRSPDLAPIEAVKDDLASSPCQCWARRNVLPEPGPRQPEPKPASSPVARLSLPSPRQRLKGTGRPLKSAPAPEALSAAIGTALAPERLQPRTAPPNRKASDRQVPPHPMACQFCGAVPPGRPRNDGTPRRHRVRPFDPFAPWCRPAGVES